MNLGWGGGEATSTKWEPTAREKTKDARARRARVAAVRDAHPSRRCRTRAHDQRVDVAEIVSEAFTYANEAASNMAVSIRTRVLFRRQKRTALHKLASTSMTSRRTRVAHVFCLPLPTPLRVKHNRNNKRVRSPNASESTFASNKHTAT